MATFTLTINLDNAAMQNTEDVAEALYRVAMYTEQHDDNRGNIYGVSGVLVGSWEYGS